MERALLPPGVEGELFIGGAGVARGYLGRPELTAERFLPNPYGPGQLYRTGDRVRWRADGELEFLGRADDQMKINGIRVEPGEIEATLLALPGIAAAVVTLYEDACRRAPPRRVISSASSGAAPATDNVRAALERQLPRNMVPTYFVWLDAMPLTPNGKLDRKALPAPAARGNSASYRPSARNQNWSARSPKSGKICCRCHRSASDRTFSILAVILLRCVSLFATIEARFGRHLTVDVLAGGLTIAGLAQMLAETQSRCRPRSDPVVALQPLGHLPPFFCVHGIGGDVLHLHRLAVHMGTDRPFFGLRRTAEFSPH